MNASRSLRRMPGLSRFIGLAIVVDIAGLHMPEKHEM